MPKYAEPTERMAAALAQAMGNVQEMKAKSEEQERIAQLAMQQLQEKARLEAQEAEKNRQAEASDKKAYRDLLQGQHEEEMSFNREKLAKESEYQNKMLQAETSQTKVVTDRQDFERQSKLAELWYNAIQDYSRSDYVDQDKLQGMIEQYNGILNKIDPYGITPRMEPPPVDLFNRNFENPTSWNFWRNPGDAQRVVDNKRKDKLGNILE